MAGILLPVFAARHARDYGIGDTRALGQWLDWAANHSIGFIQLLPIHEHGADESPYSAISTAAIDPIYLALDPEGIPWLEPADFARHEPQAAQLRALEHVDHAAVRAVKRRVLESAWSRFDAAPAALRTEWREFCREQADWLEDYTIFRLLMERFGAHLGWHEWPEECRTAKGARRHVQSLIKSGDPAISARLDYHSMVQWLCHRQWTAVRRQADRLGVQLMGDMPIGVAHHSCDVFFNREDFDLEWFGGSPAEGNQADNPFMCQWGQNWGIPLYRWQRMEAGGCSWWRQRIQRLQRFFHIFRIDHILGFYRMYGFPWHPQDNPRFINRNHDEVAAMTGGRMPRWCPRSDDSPEDRAANLREADHRLRMILKGVPPSEVVAEDLGWVPDYIRPHLAELGIAGFRIPHWDCDHAGRPTAPVDMPVNAITCYSTHDHIPIQMTWKACHALIEGARHNPWGYDHWQVDGARHTLRVLSEFARITPAADGQAPPFSESVRLRLVKALMSSRSRLALLMVTELFGIDARINTPGTFSSANWTFRLPWTLEEIMGDPQLAEICSQLRMAATLANRKVAPSA